MKGILPGLTLTLWLAGLTATVAAADDFSVPQGAVLESGDTWSADGQRYRLYGLQSCLRGTAYTDRSGQKQDCGDASLAVLAAFLKDTRPACAPIVKASSITYVVCAATVSGQKLDLATMLITEGYGFAALDAKGMPINAAYAVAEQEARIRKAGLWQFPDLQHPSVLLSHAARQGEGHQK